MKDHENVSSKQQNEATAVDAEIAQLVCELKKLRISPTDSGRGPNSEVVWLEFFTLDEVTRFLEIVAEYEEECDSLYGRIILGWEQAYGFVYHGLWGFGPATSEMPPLNEEGEINDEDGEGTLHCIFGMTVSFPSGDLPTVIARVKHYNDIVAGCRNLKREAA